MASGGRAHRSNDESEYLKRRSLDKLCSRNPSQKQGSSSPRKKKDGSKLDKSPEKKPLYPLLPNSGFNGDWSEQEYEDLSYEEHERATTQQENEELTDDSSEESIDGESLHMPPQKTVIGAHHVQRQISPRILKLYKDKAVPKPSTSYKYVKNIVCTLVVLLCAIAAAFFGAPYWSQILEQFPKTNSSPQPVDDIIQNLKNEFGEQPLMTFKIINIALHKVTKPYPEAPAIILLLAEQGAEDVATRFARKIAYSVASSNNVFMVSGHTYDTKDPDEAKREIDDLLTENLSTDRLNVVLVERLDVIPPDVALIFHTYCDHENASFKRVVYLMTIASTKTQLKSLTNKDWDFIANEHLSEVWSKGGNDQISSLLSRLTVSVAAIVPGR